MLIKQADLRVNTIQPRKQLAKMNLGTYFFYECLLSWILFLFILKIYHYTILWQGFTCNNFFQTEKQIRRQFVNITYPLKHSTTIIRPILTLWLVYSRYLQRNQFWYKTQSNNDPRCEQTKNDTRLNNINWMTINSKFQIVWNQMVYSIWGRFSYLSYFHSTE